MTPIAFLDIETTGLDPERHEIIEIAVQRVDPVTLHPLRTLNMKVHPEHLETADPVALRVAGFEPAAWRLSRPLDHALREAAPLLAGALVAGHNVGFDWRFLERNYRRRGLPLPMVDYHRLDTASLAWPLLSSGELRSLSLDSLCTYFGIPRPSPHRALADVKATILVARRLRERVLGGTPTAPASRPPEPIPYGGPSRDLEAVAAPAPPDSGRRPRRKA